MKLALLLRGINVGGNNKIAMRDLKVVLADLGYTDITTILNSGNAVVDHVGQARQGRVTRRKAIATSST